jgi:uncharacterized protein (DUF3084 family)
VKIREIINLYGKWIIAGLIILLVLIAIQRGCRIHYLETEYLTLKSQYDLLEKQADSELKKALEYIKAQDLRIAAQNEIITAKDKEIAEKYGNIDSLNGQLSKLEQEFAALTEAPAKIANLQSQVNGLKAKCLQFESIIADKDAQLGGWMIKFEAQAGISETWKARYEAEYQLRLDADDMLKIQEKRVKSLSFGTNIKTIAIIAVSGYLAYDLIRGKGK